jgi:hypothetical protein
MEAGASIQSLNFYFVHLPTTVLALQCHPS